MNISGTPDELRAMKVLTAKEHEALLQEIATLRRVLDQRRIRDASFECLLAVLQQLWDVAVPDGTHRRHFRFTAREREEVPHDYMTFRECEDGSLLVWWSYTVGEPQNLDLVPTGSDLLPWLKASLRCQSCATRETCPKLYGCPPPDECGDFDALADPPAHHVQTTRRFVADWLKEAAQ